MKKALALSLLFAGALHAQHARAQLTSVPAPSPALAPGIWVPSLTLPSLLSTGDESGDRGDLSPRVAAEPLRLSLQSPIFPVGPGFDGCTTRTDASGNSVNGFPVQRFWGLRLAPRLTLAGFSNGGCPIDGAVGGGLTYAIPLRASLWLVTSGGFYAVPGRGSALPPRTSADLRMDLVKQTDSGRTFHFGIEEKKATGVGSTPMVTFGMGF